MKKIITFVFFIVLAFSGFSQNLKTIPYSEDFKDITNGWYQFIYQGVDFDVEIESGKLIKGKIIWQNGDVYSGSLSGQYISGKGTYTWSNGIRYEGSFKKNKRHGKGTMILNDNSKWSGKWENNMRQGKGKEFDVLGNVIKKGYWENNRFVTKKK